jgi:hypothetical protein
MSNSTWFEKVHKLHFPEPQTEEQYRQHLSFLHRLATRMPRRNVRKLAGLRWPKERAAKEAFLAIQLSETFYLGPDRFQVVGTKRAAIANKFFSPMNPMAPTGIDINDLISARMKSFISPHLDMMKGAIEFGLWDIVLELFWEICVFNLAPLFQIRHLEIDLDEEVLAAQITQKMIGYDDVMRRMAGLIEAVLPSLELTGSFFGMFHEVWDGCGGYDSVGRGLLDALWIISDAISVIAANMMPPYDPVAVEQIGIAYEKGMFDEAATSGWVDIEGFDLTWLVAKREMPKVSKTVDESPKPRLVHARIIADLFATGSMLAKVGVPDMLIPALYLVEQNQRKFTYVAFAYAVLNTFKALTSIPPCRQIQHAMDGIMDITKKHCVLAHCKRRSLPCEVVDEIVGFLLTNAVRETAAGLTPDNAVILTNQIKTFTKLENYKLGEDEDGAKNLFCSRRFTNSLIQAGLKSIKDYLMPRMPGILTDSQFRAMERAESDSLAALGLSEAVKHLRPLQAIVDRVAYWDWSAHGEWWLRANDYLGDNGHEDKYDKDVCRST